jgi:hypothetical protein
LIIKELVPASNPERLEHIRYVLAITSAPIAFLAALFAFVDWSLRTAFRLALFGQAVLVLGWMYARRSETFVYFTPDIMLLGDALAAAICIFVAVVPAAWIESSGVA